MFSNYQQLPKPTWCAREGAKELGPGFSCSGSPALGSAQPSSPKDASLHLSMASAGIAAELGAWYGPPPRAQPTPAPHQQAEVSEGQGGLGEMIWLWGWQECHHPGTLAS